MSAEDKMLSLFSHLWQDADWWDKEEWAVTSNDVAYLLRLRPAVFYASAEVMGDLAELEGHMEERERIDEVDWADGPRGNGLGPARVVAGGGARLLGPARRQVGEAIQHRV